MLDMTTQGMAEVEAMGLALRPQEDSGLCLGKQDSDLDSMTKHFREQKNKIQVK